MYFHLSEQQHVKQSTVCSHFEPSVGDGGSLTMPPSRLEADGDRRPPCCLVVCFQTKDDEAYFSLSVLTLKMMEGPSGCHCTIKEIERAALSL